MTILLLLSLCPALPTRAEVAANPAVPVTTVLPVRGDVPVLARAIGTAQAFESVVVRARVDGTLDKVVFTEGQQVTPGDVPAQLDSRPYQAILDQAIAKRAADEALLANARGDLVRYADLAQSRTASRQRLGLQSANVAQAEANVHGDDVSISAAMAQLDAPATLRGTFQGTAQAVQASLGTQPYLIAAALIAVYIILGVLYESFSLPITILSTLPSAGVGSELRRSLGYAMMGGLLLSQVLTLCTTPVVHLYLDRLQHRLSPARRTSMPALASKIGATAD